MLSFLWCRIFISPKERLRPRNIWNCFGDLCVFSVFTFISFSCMWIFHDFKFWFCFFVFNSFLRRGFGMSSNLWYKYRLLVLGSAPYTLKPLNSEDNYFRVIPSTCATLKTRLGLWEQLTKFWKDAIFFLWISPFLMFTCTSLPRWCPRLCGQWSCSPGAIFSVVLDSCGSRALSSFLQW